MELRLRSNWALLPTRLSSTAALPPDFDCTEPPTRESANTLIAREASPWTLPITRTALANNVASASTVTLPRTRVPVSWHVAEGGTRTLSTVTAPKEVRQTL